MNARQTPWLESAERLGRWVENAILFTLLSGLIVLASYQILLRNVFSMGLPWADGVIRLMVLWLGLAGGIAASRDRKQIRIDIITRALPASAKRFTDLVAHLFTATVTGLLAWHSFRFVLDSYAFEDTLLGDWPAWVFQVILPIGFAAISYRYLIWALRDLLGSEK